MRVFAALVLGAVGAARLAAQTGGTCVPVAERGNKTLGCFITARAELGRLPKTPPLYWHLDQYTDEAAASKAKSARSTVVESLGRTWLFTIAEQSWQPTGGRRVALIGPLPLVQADSFAAVYMEGVFEPGMQSLVHRHPGVEAWYTPAGSMCLETPNGTVKQQAGQPGVMIEGGSPMVLSGTGTGVRRSLVLILQDATKERSTAVHDWTPKGLC